MQRRFPYRVKECADILAGANTKTNRSVCGPKCRRSNSRNILSQALSEYRHSVNVAELPLISSKTERGVTFDVFDISIAFANGDTNIGDARVVLIINKLLCTTVRIGRRRHTP